MQNINFSQVILLPGYNFKLKINSIEFIETYFQNIIFPKCENKLKSWSLLFYITFANDKKNVIEKTIVMGPSRNNYSKTMTYGIHLPSTKIYNVENGERFGEFCTYFFEALTEFFYSKYDIPVEDIQEIEKQVRSKFSPIDGSPITEIAENR